MAGRVVKKIMLWILAVLLLMYVGFQIYSASSISIKTETAEYMQVSDIIEATGHIVRQETIIQTESAGVMTYLLDDGDKVGKNCALAEMYSSSGDVAAKSQIEQLTKEIERLKQLDNTPEAVRTTSPDLLDKQINQNFHSLITSITHGKYSQIKEQREDLLYLLNERQIITQKVDNFSARIAELENELASLQSSHGASVGTVTSPVAGYFVSTLDGYENGFSYETILDITPEQVDAGPTKSEIPANTVGKVVSGVDWYVVCHISGEESLSLSEGKQVYLSMPFASSEKIPATVAALNQVNRQSDAAVVLQCNYMDSDLANIRKETVQIITDQPEGIRVSNKAIHLAEVDCKVLGEDGKPMKDEATGEFLTQKKEVKGVYVLYGSQLQFKEIVSVYTSASYTLCKQNPDTSELNNINNETIKLYDEVVVEGTGLEDGKIVK